MATSDWPVLTAMSIRDEQLIAEAVLAERERIASKADKWADDLDGFKDKAPRDVMRGFAAAVRTEGKTDAKTE